jgi:2-polyprenyl-6-methoxyphenol hydroxylase-like FAD-dependent oxidoreductase
VKFHIIDRNADAAPFSRALGVHARTLEFYRQLGFAEHVIDGGVVMHAINLWVKRKKKARLPFDDIGTDLTPYPFVLDFAQDKHERVLIDELSRAGVRVERSTELTGFTEAADGVTATTSGPGGVERTVRARFIAGCDGAHSQVRHVCGIGFAGGSYERLFYVADVEATGAVTNSELHVDLDVADLLAVFAMKGDGHVRLVGTVLPNTGEDGREPTFNDVRHRPIEELGVGITKVNWFSTYRVHHRVATTFRKGRAFLLGDAAHIHSPVGAQGMNTGIGDAVNLSWKLADVLRGGDATLLDSYEIERMAFARTLIATTDRAFTIVTKGGPIATFVRTVIVPGFAASLFRLRAVRREVFLRVSQTQIHYRRSPLSRGRAGRVRGGDRLPWIPSAHNASFADNFAPLGTLTWQVHVYGEVTPGAVDRYVRRGIAVHVFPWAPDMKSAGVERNAPYLIRPDGYVAVAGRDDDQ